MATILAYVCGNSAGGIMVIDTSTGLQTATINAGTSYAYDCITPDGKTIYATRTTASLIDVIDVATLTTITTISSTSPVGIAITPDGSKVYAPDGSNAVTVIDTSTNTVITTITIPTGGAVDWASVSPDGTKAYFPGASALSTGGLVTVVDTSTDTISGVIVLGLFVGSNTPVGISADGSTGYVGYAGTSLVSVLNLVTNTLTTSFTVSNIPDGQDEVVNGATLYTGGLGNLLSVASTSSNTETSTVSGTGANEGLAITPDGSLLVITDAAHSLVYLLDTATNTIATAVTTTGTGQGVCVTPEVTPPVSLVVGNLFIPRKGRGAPLGEGYEPEDFLIDFLAIERWANTEWTPKAPNLFIPCKPSGRSPTIPELNTNWLWIELWTQSIGTLGGVLVKPLLIPRKDSIESIDLDTDFISIQQWANTIG